MESLVETWSRLSAVRKGVLVTSVIGTFVTLFLLLQAATAPQMSLLFRGMEDAAAGEIATALDQMGVPNEVRGNAIYVPADQRDRLRVELSADGLVKDGAVGYEILDEMSGFGTTREMFRTAVKRAIEGELQRTIEAMPDVRRARILIGQDERRPFERDQAQVTASVSVLSTGGRLSPSTARGIRYLVALAVPGLEPDNVGVIDMENGVVLAPGGEESSQASEEREERIAGVLRRRLEALLVNHVGEGNFTVQVTVETTREARTVNERIIDPDSQAPTSSQTTSSTESSTTPSAAVTVASQLPDGDAAGGGGQGQTDRSTSSESVAYAYSTTERAEVVEPGAIKRLGVAIVLDEREEVGPEGAVIRTPRSREELQVIEGLVKAAIAFDEARGDEVEVVSIAFVDAPALEGFGDVAEGPSFLDEHGALLIQLGVLALVAIVLGLFVVRPILRSNPGDALDPETPLIEGALAPLADGSAPELAAPGQAALVASDGAGAGADVSDALAVPIEEGAAPALADGGNENAVGPVALRHLSQTQTEELRAAVRDKFDSSLSLLKSWLTHKADEPGERGV